MDHRQFRSWIRRVRFFRRDRAVDGLYELHMPGNKAYWAVQQQDGDVLLAAVLHPDRPGHVPVCAVLQVVKVRLVNAEGSQSVYELRPLFIASLKQGNAVGLATIAEAVYQAVRLGTEGRTHG
jgi:hypothetical protein